MGSSHRKQQILASIDLGRDLGVEIGPLDRAVVSRSEGRVLYMDHLDTRGLRAKYEKNASAGLVDVDKLPEIDLVADGRPFVEILGDRGPVDYVIASHVIEHIADPLGWLRDLAAGLSDGGRVSLVVPDKRFTFDHFRQISVAGDLVGAALVKAATPSPGAIYDYFSTVAQIDPGAVWGGGAVERVPVPGHLPPEALRRARLAASGEETSPDIHRFVYTAWSFAEILRELITLDLLPYEVAHYEPTAAGSIEFFVTLRKSDAPPRERAATVPLLDPADHHELPAPAPAASEPTPPSPSPMSSTPSPMSSTPPTHRHCPPSPPPPPPPPPTVTLALKLLVAAILGPRLTAAVQRMRRG